MMSLEEGVGVMGADDDYNGVAVKDGCRRIRNCKYTKREMGWRHSYAPSSGDLQILLMSPTPPSRRGFKEEGKQKGRFLCVRV